MGLRVIIADDIPGSLDTLGALLRTRFEVVASARNGAEALAAIRELKPDVAVLDLTMPELNGIEVTREAMREHPQLAIIICSVHRDPELIKAAAEAGARGYVVKMDMFHDLVNAVESITKGESFFPQLIQLQ